uniref:DUF4384 domain-containing protein n=1 Tax=Desulfomonile tiedjei TaxID=2358 RepID=A0A7C4ETP8_9BACT
MASSGHRSSWSKNCPAIAAAVFNGCAWIIMLFSSVGAVLANPPSGDLYAVVVGITTYKDPQIRPLKVSDKDARDVANLVEDVKHLFRSVHLTLLLNEQATRDRVTKALRDELKGARKEDYVIIYLSGHGAADPNRPDEYYFITHDAKMNNLYGTAVWMNQKALFKGIDSDRVLLIADACHSGGFSPGLDKMAAKEAGAFFSLFQGLKGRLALVSSRPDETSLEDERLGNSIFTHFLIKGLRGEAARDSRDGKITAGQLYQYVYKAVRKATNDRQSPQLYAAKGADAETPVFRVPVYDQPLSLKVEYVWKDDQGRIQPLTSDSVLKSGQKFAVRFRPEADCYVSIFWWDTAGNVGRLFPDDRLVDGSGAVKRGIDYWIPTQEDGRRWFVLDKNVGKETFYFLASRVSNPRIQNLYQRLRSMSKAAREGAFGKLESREIAKQLDQLMGVEPETVPMERSRGSIGADTLSEAMENEIKVSGAEAVYRLTFTHASR